MPSSLPIGIFDSGIGGLSVLSHVRTLLPCENISYVADRGYLPYGNKTDAFIYSRAQIITDFLLSQPVKAIVVACNTATAAAIHTLRETYDIPIIGMEPGVKPAIQASHNGNIGVLATEGTLGSHKFRDLIERHANGSDLFIKPCHGWVEHIEAGDLNEAETLRLIETTLTPLLEKDVDTLVLGCTHYPFLAQQIKQLAGEEIAIVDTGYAVAAHLKRRLEENDLLTSSNSSGKERFWSSGALNEMRELLARLWDPNAHLASLPDQANFS
jgi:glutamate racemase